MSKNQRTYEVFFAVLALFAVSLAVADILNKIPPSFRILYIITDRAILIVFAIDYFYGLFKSEDKKAYFKNNIFELLSIIPLDSFFRGFRIFRIIRIVRVIFLARRMSKRSLSFLHTNGFVYVLIITLSTIFIGGVAIYYIDEKTITSFSDALWWSFVTTTTVGYGDLSPVSGAGRIIAVFLMLIGIGFVGMLTGTIATYFLRKPTKSKDPNPSQILDLTDLEPKKYVLIKEYTEYIRSKD